MDVRDGLGTTRSVLGEGVFRRVEHPLRPVEADVLDAQHAHRGEERLAHGGEGHGGVVREPLLDKDVAVEASHLLDRDDPDPAERSRIDVQNRS